MPASPSLPTNSCVSKDSVEMRSGVAPESTSDAAEPQETCLKVY